MAREIYQDTLKVASFNDVEFNIERNTTTAGKRVEVHEYPYRDLPYVEEYGLKAKSYNIEAYLIGDDCTAQRDALLTQLEKAGLGTLVHPYYGTLKVVVADISISEDWSRGREVRISFTCYMSDQQYPSPTTQQKMPLAAANANKAISNRFVDNVQTKGLPDVASESLKNNFTEISKKSEKAFSVLGIGQTINLSDFLTLIPTLINDPRALVDGYIGVLDDLVTSQLNLMFGQYYDVDVSRIISIGKSLTLKNTTKTSGTLEQTIAKNTTESEHFAKAALIIKACELLVEDPVKTNAPEGVSQVNNEWLITNASQMINNAESAYAITLKAIDELAQEATDEEYVALVNLREAVQTDTNEYIRALKALKTHTRGDNMPTLVLAYENGMQEYDFNKLNKVRHPLIGLYEYKTL